VPTCIYLVPDCRIDLSNEISQNLSDIETWRFGFNLQSPDVWHEEVGAVIRAMLLSEGGHTYPQIHASTGSPRIISRTWVGTTDCAFMKVGASGLVDGVTKLDVTTPQITVLASGQVDGPSLAIPRQGDDPFFTQRFALRTHDAFSATEDMKFAMEYQNPLITEVVRGGVACPEDTFSLLSISDPKVLLWVLKSAEEGVESGIIVGVWNLSSDPRNFQISLAEGVTRATLTTHIEADLENLRVPGGVVCAKTAPWQMSTFRLFSSKPNQHSAAAYPDDKTQQVAI
jgi:alpha-mannosidase